MSESPGERDPAGGPARERPGRNRRPRGRRQAWLATALLAAAGPSAAGGSGLDPALLARGLDRAASLPRLHALIVARDGQTVVERAFRGPGLDTPVNVKSISKSVISALVGAAIARRVLPAAWVRDSWVPRTHSPYSGDAYGYAWFIGEACGHSLYYARGFGGQFVYVAPDLGTTIVITSDPGINTRVGGYRWALHDLVDRDLVPAAIAGGRGGGRAAMAERCRTWVAL